MPYYVIDPKEAEPTFNRPSIQRSISETAKLNARRLHLYEAVPSEQISFIYHDHDGREKMFYDFYSAAFFEILVLTYVIKSGEVFVPEAADSPVQLLAIGRPVIDVDHPYNLDSTSE